jgi:hypothetical protein
MLPPTVFPFFRPSLDSHHPANTQLSHETKEGSHNDVDAMALASEPDPCFFTEPFFKAGIRTFQVCGLVILSYKSASLRKIIWLNYFLPKDHLYSGWLTPAHDALVREYIANLQKGKMHAPWKDDVWSEEHPVVERNTSNADGLAG